MWEARKRGVIFDAGHGGGSFLFSQAVPALKQGFAPDVISTDLHTGSMNAGMQDMITTMSKCLAMGMPLKEVIRASTWRPAQVIHREELGHLTVGAVADIAALRVHDGDFNYADAFGARFTGKQRMTAEITVRAGRVVWNANSRGGQDWRKLSPTYGIRPGIDHIVPPPAK